MIDHHFYNQRHFTIKSSHTAYDIPPGKVRMVITVGPDDVDKIRAIADPLYGQGAADAAQSSHTPAEGEPVAEPSRTLQQELRAIINRASRENLSHTPDFILADYLYACLLAFETASNLRALWSASNVLPNETHLMSGPTAMHMSATNALHASPL